MKSMRLAILVLAEVVLAACSRQANRPAQPAANGTTTDTPVPPAVQTTAPTQTTANDAVEEAEIRDFVENFGRRLQAVSLLSPTAAEDIQEQYAEFVSPALLEQWESDASTAPGRMVSSPWPDRIEVTTLSREAPEMYTMSGYVVEVTSAELASGEAAARIPVRIVVQKEQGHWLITEYTEER